MAPDNTKVTIKFQAPSTGIFSRRSVPPSTFTLDDLKAWVAEVMGPGLPPPTLTYCDPEGDECAINTTESLTEALEMAARSGSPLRLYLTPTTVPATTAPVTTTAVASETSKEPAPKTTDTTITTAASASTTAPKEEEHEEEEEEDVMAVLAALVSQLEEAWRASSPKERRCRPFIARMSQDPEARIAIRKAALRYTDLVKGQVGAKSFFDALGELLDDIPITTEHQEQPVNTTAATPTATAEADAAGGKDKGKEDEQGNHHQQGGEGHDGPSAVPSTTKAPRGGVHHDIMCDGCGVEPIVGLRFMSVARHNYDLCEACEAKDDSPHSSRLFFVISDPDQTPDHIKVLYNRCAARRPSRDGDHIHHHITCNGCQQGPITGNRFKCTVRDDYDLCEPCFREDTSGFPMIKITRASLGPIRVHAPWRHHHHHRRHYHHHHHHGRHHGHQENADGAGHPHHPPHGPHHRPPHHPHGRPHGFTGGQPEFECPISSPLGVMLDTLLGGHCRFWEGHRHMVEQHRRLFREGPRGCGNKDWAKDKCGKKEKGQDCC